MLLEIRWLTIFLELSSKINNYLSTTHDWCSSAVAYEIVEKIWLLIRIFSESVKDD